MEEVKPDNTETDIRIVEVKSTEQSSEETVVRLTPTGKISHAKTRVYTQRYRKEWEHMSDFKDWLTSVPFQATRAFCKYCQRNLHAHRLSLLKHMCTLKHQRAAVQYNKREATNNDQQGEDSNDMSYFVESVDGDDYENENENENENDDDNIEGITEVEDDDNNDGDVNLETTEYIQEEELNIDGERQVEVIEESECVVESSPVLKKMRIVKEEAQDALAQAMSHVHSDYLIENDDPLTENDNLELEMEVVNDHEDEHVGISKQYQYIKYETPSNTKDEEQKEAMSKNNKIEDITDEAIKTLLAAGSKGSTQNADNSKKVYFFSSGGKTYSLVKSQLPQVVMNQLQEKNFTVVTKVAKGDAKSKDTSNDSTNKINITNTIVRPVTLACSSKELKKNASGKTTNKSVLLKKPIISTHVLETSKGVPVIGLQVSLYKLQEGRWTFIYESITTANGNCNDFSSCAKNNLTTGRYKLHYDVEKYYNMRKLATIYPFIEIVFDIKDPNASYHIPLLVSPFSYSTFKDSDR